MVIKMGKIPITEFFIALQEEMISKLSTDRRLLEHPVSKGDSSELNWLEWLKTYLPKRYSADKAFAIDYEGNTSDQLDLVIYDQHYSPFVFKRDGAIFIPAESIYAVFEVKQELTKDNIEYAARKIASVRELKRTRKEIVHAGGKYPPRELTKIVGGILTLESSWSPPFGKAFLDAMNIHEEKRIINIGCCLRHGSFYKEEDQAEHIEISAKESSLITFFLNLLDTLQSIGTVQAIDLVKYKEAIIK